MLRKKKQCKLKILTRGTQHVFATGVTGAPKPLPFCRGDCAQNRKKFSYLKTPHSLVQKAAFIYSLARITVPLLLGEHDVAFNPV